MRLARGRAQRGAGGNFTHMPRGERAFESLGGGASQANSPEPPSEMSCLGVLFRFQFYQTVRGTHNQKPVQRIPHILRSTPRQSQGGASSLSEKSCLVVAFRLLFKHTFYGTRHPKTVQRTLTSLSPLTQPTLAPPLSCLGVLFPFSFLKKVPTP